MRFLFIFSVCALFFGFTTSNWSHAYHSALHWKSDPWRRAVNGDWDCDASDLGAPQRRQCSEWKALAVAMEFAMVYEEQISMKVLEPEELFMVLAVKPKCTIENANGVVSLVDTQLVSAILAVYRHYACRHEQQSLSDNSRELALRAATSSNSRRLAMLRMFSTCSPLEKILQSYKSPKMRVRKPKSQADAQSQKSDQQQHSQEATGDWNSLVNHLANEYAANPQKLSPVSGLSQEPQWSRELKGSRELRQSQEQAATTSSRMTTTMSPGGKLAQVVLGEQHSRNGNSSRDTQRSLEGGHLHNFRRRSQDLHQSRSPAERSLRRYNSAPVDLFNDQTQFKWTNKAQCQMVQSLVAQFKGAQQECHEARMKYEMDREQESLSSSTPASSDERAMCKMGKAFEYPCKVLHNMFGSKESARGDSDNYWKMKKTHLDKLRCKLEKAMEFLEKDQFLEQHEARELFSDESDNWTPRKIFCI